MAADAKSFGISIGVDAAIGFACFLFFCIMRLRKLMRHFYMPRQFMADSKRAGKPPALPKRFAGWIRPAWGASEGEIIRVAGYDAAMYVKVLSLAFEVFLWTSLWVLIIVLPTNLVGNNVNTLTSSGNVPTSPYTYWVPPQQGGTSSGSPPAKISAPKFYTPTPPAPAGLQWWNYAPGVPPLPNPASVLGQGYSNYGWRYDDQYSAQSYTFSQLDHVTLTNVAIKSNLLWVHAIACYFVAIIVMRRLWAYSRAAVVLHLAYLNNAEKGAQTHSVLVTDIPGTAAGTVTGFVPEKVRKGLTSGAEKTKVQQALETSTNFVLPSSAPNRRTTSSMRSSDVDGRPTAEDVEGAPPGHSRRVTPRESDVDAWASATQRLRAGMTVEQMVRSEYEELFEGDVAEVHVVYKTDSLDDLVKDYDSGLRDLEDLIDDYASQWARNKKVKRKQTRVLGWRHGEWGKKNYPGWLPVKTDLLDWHVKKLTELRRQILEEQEVCRDKPSPTAFVTFNSRRSQTIASNSLQHPDVSSWHTASAPAPNEIIWENVRHRAWQRQFRFVVIWVLFVLMALFYTIPVAAVQAIIEVDRLSGIPGFKALIDITFIRSIIEAILPGLVLNIFLALLPLIIRIMNKQQGMFSETQIDFGLNRKYFIFLIVTVFLGTIIGGSLFTQFNQWIDNPQSAVSILGTAAPLTSLFFLTYILLQAFTSLPLSFLRLFGLVMYWIKSKLAATPRAKARVWSEQRYQFGTELPRHMLIFFVGVVYSVINPLIPVMTFIYFSVALLTERYNMLYIYSPKFDSGGKLWAEVYEQIIAALFFFEIIMIALLAIKKSFAAILIGPLLIITVIFWRACRPVFQKPMSVLSLRTAVDMDHNDALRAEEIPLEEEESPDPEKKVTYLMPAMDFHERRHENVLKEAAEMELVLDGKKELQMENIGEDVDGDQEQGSATPTETNGDSAILDTQGTSNRSLQPLVAPGVADSANAAYLRQHHQ